MTVRELIDKLEEYEDDYDVFVQVPEGNSCRMSEFVIRQIEDGSDFNVYIYIE